MPKPTVYLETTIVGHLVGRLQTNLLVVARQMQTREWWADAAQDYELVISPLVVDECSSGDAVVAVERLKLIESLCQLELTGPCEMLATKLIADAAVPATEPRDALHIAVAAAHNVDNLLTWNFKHIANASTRERIEESCLAMGFRPPVICTPEELS